MQYGKKMGMEEAYKKATKMSPKQQKIADAAKPKGKITGADFKALKKKGK